MKLRNLKYGELEYLQGYYETKMGLSRQELTLNAASASPEYLTRLVSRLSSETRVVAHVESELVRRMMGDDNYFDCGSDELKITEQFQKAITKDWEELNGARR